MKSLFSQIKKYTIIASLLLIVGVAHIWGATKTEDFEKQTAGTSYQSTQTYTTANSNAGIAWTIYYGCVSTANKITGSNSAAMRLYNGNNHYGYLQSTTAVTGLTQITFNAKAQDSNSGKIYIDIQYSTNGGSSWSYMKKTSASGSNYSAQALTTKKASYSAYIPTAAISSSSNFLIKISINSGSTKPTSGNCQLTIDDLVFTYDAGYAITLDKNGGSANGSATVAANATTLTAISAPTKTGYEPEGYYTNAACTTKIATPTGALQPNITVSATTWTNGSSQWKKGGVATFYTNWTPKVCTITLDKGTSGTTGGTASYTYGNSDITSITHATRTGYHLTGYYTASSSGTKILNADGSLAGNNITVSTKVYTSGGNWAYDGKTLTLYAQWEIDDYTIAWKANGNSWTTGVGSSNNHANYNNKITAMPTAPSSSDCDGSKVFVGWTTNKNYTHATDAPSDLFSTIAESPKITKDTTFYAVFATKSNSSSTATFDAATLSGLTEDDTYWIWTHDASDIEFGINKGQRYTGGTPYTFTVTNGTANSAYLECPKNKIMTSVAVTLSESTYKIGSVTSGWVLSTDGTSQSVTHASGSTYLELFATSSNQIRITSLTATYYTFTKFSTSCCTTDPSVGNPSFGSISSGTIGVLCEDGVTDDCETDEFGFIWKKGSAPSSTSDGTKVKVGESDEGDDGFLEELSIDFETGETYYIKAYATNPHGTVLSTSALTVTPRSVTFNSNGGSAIATAYVNSGAKVSEPSAPTKTGYSFNEWQLSGSTYDFSSAVSADITLVADWTPDSYDIILDKNGGSADGSAVATYNSGTLTSWSGATYTDHEVIGYYTDETSGDKVIKQDGTLVANVSPYTDADGKWIYDDDAIFFAHWKSAGTYNVAITSPSNGTITVSWNDGSAHSFTSGNQDINKSNTITITAAGNSGYQLATNGLKVNGETFTSGGTIDLEDFADEIEIAATFSTIEYTITYNLNGGSNPVSPAPWTSYTIASSAYTLPTPTKLGHEFEGWYTESTFENKVTGIAAGSTGNKAFWANWTVNDYTLSFNANGGTGSMDDEDRSYNSTSALPANTFTRTDYRFLGWATTSEGEVEYEDEDDYTMGAADATLYAKWQRLVYNDWVFSCAELELTPKLVTANTPIFITSAASKTVRSQDSILVKGSGLTPSTALSFPDLPTQFAIKSSANGALSTDANGDIDTVAYIFYTPASESTEDGLDELTALNVKVSGVKPRQKTLSGTEIKGRHLPANFVIAAKNTSDGKWYALPATMTAKATPEPIEIIVDNATTPTKVLGANTLVYNLYGQNSGAGYLEEAGQYVKLGMKHNTNANAPLFAYTDSGIKGDGTVTVTNNIGKQYWWLLTQTNTSISDAADAKYIVSSPNNTSNSLRAWWNASPNAKWGLYANGTNELRLIPYVGGYIEATINEWSQHDIAVTVDAESVDATKASAQLDDITTDVADLTNTGTTNEYLVRFGDDIDFAGQNNNVVLLKWLDNNEDLVGASFATIPSIIAAEGTEEEWTDFATPPTAEDIVVLSKPIEISSVDAKAKKIVLDQSGTNNAKLTINANKALVVTEKILVDNGTSFVTTTAADLVIKSTAAGNGTLIFENNENEATVEMYSIGSTTAGSNWTWQYIGVPFTSVDPQASYYGGYLYKWENNQWNTVHKDDELTAFTGYSVSYPAANHKYVMDGELAPTTSKDISVPAGKDMVVGNSWTAPIQIKQLQDADFSNLSKNVYLFNTGSDVTGEAGSAKTRYEAGTYVTVPIHSSPYTGDSVISALQGFFVTNNTVSDGTLHLSYADHVRPASGNSVVNGQMHAPRRIDAENQPVVLKMWACGSRYDDKVVLLEHSDFSTELDEGWDGEKWFGGEASPAIYTTRPDGTTDAVSALPELDGTVISFRPGEDSNYTLRFEYAEDNDELYILDTKTMEIARVVSGNTYPFTCEDTDTPARFLLTRSNAPQITTGNANANANAEKATKLILDQKLYIYRNGILYDATGRRVDSFSVGSGFDANANANANAEQEKGGAE